MAKDIDLLVKNAKTYNEPGSQVFKVRVHLKARYRLLLVSKTLTCDLLLSCRMQTPLKRFLHKRSQR